MTALNDVPNEQDHVPRGGNRRCSDMGRQNGCFILDLNCRVASIEAHNLDALIAPTRGPAWLTDHINGDQSSGISSSSLAAVSGYASITVPAGDVVGLPIGISFIGAAYSDAKLIQFAYSFEQAGYARKPPLANLQN